MDHMKLLHTNITRTKTDSYCTETRSQGSSVGIATGYDLDAREASRPDRGLIARG
jgi:hypothetical protein